MSKLTLTNDNYYSADANKDYMSVSQFKDFAGTTCHLSCEETALLKYQGLIPQFKSTSLLVGSYVDSYFEGTLDAFKADNPDIFKKTGDKGLKAEYLQAEEIIKRLERDNMFMDFMSGVKQKIMTANLFGVDWKIKMDSYLPNDKIVDLKVIKDMNPIWNPSTHSKVDFIHFWGYDIQGAIYQKVVELVTGYRLPFYIACATKEKITKYELIEVTQPHLDAALEFVEQRIQHVVDVKNGVVPPSRCNECAHCLGSKTILAPITIDDIMPVQTNNEDTEWIDDEDE
jgi:hypothetical protein